MKLKFRISRRIAVLLVLVVIIVLAWWLLMLHRNDLGVSISSVSCPSTCQYLPGHRGDRLRIKSKDLPQPIKEKFAMVVNEDSRFAIFDINSYALPTGIIVSGAGYRAYLFKDFTVYADVGLGQYSTIFVGESHRRNYNELLKYVREHGKPSCAPLSETDE